MHFLGSIRNQTINACYLEVISALFNIMRKQVMLLNMCSVQMLRFRKLGFQLTILIYRESVNDQSMLQIDLF